jgi:hypothetical protein
MAFDYTNLYPDTSGNGGYTKSWNYTTLDPIATVSASGYFNKVATRIGIGDNIIVSVVDAFDKTRTTLVAFATLYVNSISGGVVTTISSTTGLLNNAALTGTPTAPTAAVDTTTSQIATTAFVIQQAASAIPLMDSTGAVGISTQYARGDHVHPTDTSRAPTVAPTFTGTAAFASMTASGTFALTGDFSVNTNKFTVTAASGNTSVAGTLLVTGATTLSAALTYGGVTLSNAVTGTGNMVLSASPTFTGTATVATLAATTINGFTLAGAIAGGGQNITNLGTIASTAHAITSASANALAAGLNGATNPAFNVDASTGSQVAGLNVKGAATGGTVAVSVTDSGANANLAIDAKGTGTIAIGGQSTGLVSVGPGGTGAGINGKIILNGSNAANSGGIMQFQRNSVNLFAFGNSSAVLGGASNDFVIYSYTTGAGTVSALSVSDANGGVFVGSHFGTTAPVTKTNNFSWALTENSIICNGGATITATLPAAATYTGRILWIRTIAAFTVVSASSNVVPLAGGAAGTAILAATAGKWAMLQSDGSNWQIMASN